MYMKEAGISNKLASCAIKKVKFEYAPWFSLKESIQSNMLLFVHAVRSCKNLIYVKTCL